MIKTIQLVLISVTALGIASTAHAGEPEAAFSIVQLQKGIISFDLTPDDLDENGKPEDWLILNQDGKLTCNADVSTVVISGASSSIIRINRTLRDFAEQARCTHDQDISDLIPKVTYISPEAVSLSFERTEYGKGANGSCHTHSEYLNFDLESGVQYRLPDILRSDAFPKIRQDILTSFLKDPGINQKDLGELLDREFWAMGFFIKDHKLYVDLDSYLKSCVEGPFFPVEINTAYINTERAPPWLETALNINFPPPN